MEESYSTDYLTRCKRLAESNPFVLKRIKAFVHSMTGGFENDLNQVGEIVDGLDSKVRSSLEGIVAVLGLTQTDTPEVNTLYALHAVATLQYLEEIQNMQPKTENPPKEFTSEVYREIGKEVFLRYMYTKVHFDSA